ncbi:MAG: sugar-binding protein [Victivallales bacterium]
MNLKACILAILSLLFSAMTAEADNQVLNPGFENVSDASSADWTIHKEAGRNGGNARIDEKEFHSGKRSLVLEQTHPLDLDDKAMTAPNLLTHLLGNKLDGFVIISQRVPVKAGSSYDFSFWFKSAGLSQEDRSDPKRGYANLGVTVFWLDGKGSSVEDGRKNIWVMNQQADTGQWVESNNRRFAMGGDGTPMLAPAGAVSAMLRFALHTAEKECSPRVWIDDIVFNEVDGTAGIGDRIEESADNLLPNPGFEELDGKGNPAGWMPTGSGKKELVDLPVHSEKRAAAVSDTGSGIFSGWSAQVPVEEGKSYCLSGFVKSGDLGPDGPIGGGALCLQFLDKDGQPLGEPIISQTVPLKTDWTKVRTPRSRPPADAVSVRATAGLQLCRGTAWFDDLSLSWAQAEKCKTSMVIRKNVRPSDGVTYAENLLRNGTVEDGETGKPEGWTYVGKSEPDWTKEEIERLHKNGRAEFSIGRGRGEWSHQVVYQGMGALLNISVDPPLSSKQQWYGRYMVDGYWLSDPMPCEPGSVYEAGAWIRPGAKIYSPWFGPLELKFFDASGNEQKPKNGIRAAIDNVPSGQWSYWATMPHVAPDNASTMRLRFGQEFMALEGGWGHTYADNLAVWKLPAGTSVPAVTDLHASKERLLEWFAVTHKEIKPPYLPSPSEATAYECCYGYLINSVTGNVHHDPAANVAQTFHVQNLLGEERELQLRIIRMDWLGKADEAIITTPFSIKGYCETDVQVDLPPSQSFGAFYLQADILEGDVLVGDASGRYAVLPSLFRPRTAENVWAVTPLCYIFNDGKAYEQEMGEMMRIAGFGIAWVRTNLNSMDAQAIAKEIESNKKEIEYYSKFGIKCVLQLMVPANKRPIDRKAYEDLGRIVATEFKGRALAYGNWGIENSNHRPPEAPGFRALIDGKFLSDEEYDQIMSAVYDGIKSVDQATPVLVGNIASDSNADTLKRLYGKPAEGRFDGAILNAYSSVTLIALNNLKEFNIHGDTKKTVWMEEMAAQESPAHGLERRFREADGPKNMVRTWLSLKAKCGSRCKAITMWGFARGAGGDTITMLNNRLQPRPQFAAHAVMADALANAELAADHSSDDFSLFEWKRPDSPFFAAWANTGEREITLEAPDGNITVMDLMGNTRTIKANKGLVLLKLTTMPIYLIGNMKVSRRLELSLSHGDIQPGKAAVVLNIKNNDSVEVRGTAKIIGSAEEEEKTFSVKPRENIIICVPAKVQQGEGKRTVFNARVKTSDGAVFATTASLNFAQAVKTMRPPALDGSWNDWDKSLVIPFGEPYQVQKPDVPGEEYNGSSDIYGKMRLLWDDKFLYLGVETLDDVFVAQPVRGMNGFMCDSVEFSVQPDNRLTETAPCYEYEFYLPGGKGEPAASRRKPAPSAMVENWRMKIFPTGNAGNVNYQVAIPWSDIGMKKPAAGKTISLAVVLNDADAKTAMNGGRCRIRWFEGLDLWKNPERYGDVTLVEESKAEGRN